MSIFEHRLTQRPHKGQIIPRHPHLEIAELLATAILRSRSYATPGDTFSADIETSAEAQKIRLGFSGDQSVHTNPSQTEGVFV